MTETNRYDLELPGCTPEPLMAYLKALGIFRLVGEQKDPAARGWWKHDVFCLRSPMLFADAGSEDAKRDALMKFFLEEYQPTPIVAPWNAGSGFYLKWDEQQSAFKSREGVQVLAKIKGCTSPRLKLYRDQICAITKALQEKATPVDLQKEIGELRERGNLERWSKRKADQEVKKLLDSQIYFNDATGAYSIKKADKDVLLRDVRNSFLNDTALQWLDAAYVMRTRQKKNRTEAPLLGTGGNIGNSDFSTRFMQTLTSCLTMEAGDFPSRESRALLLGALFGHPTAGLASLAADQFDPGRAGGANMYQGMEAGFRLNPWDYILMLEGAIILQSASSRRLRSGDTQIIQADKNPISDPGSAFPFTVESSPSGFDSSGSDDSRGEQWFPIWHRACTPLEIRAVIAEGRVELGKRSAQTGVEFAQAVASLGVDRGIRQFVRIQYQARFGLNYLANALGRFEVKERAGTDQLREVDHWLDRFRRAGSAKGAPARFGSALRRIETAIFEFCKFGGEPLFQEILIALGAAEGVLANADRFRDDQKLRPLAGLSSAWFTAAADQSPEFVLARALTSIDDAEKKIGPLRSNLEPVDWQARNSNWAAKNRAVVWNVRDLPANLASVLVRRLMDGTRAGCARLPIAAHFTAPLDAIAEFIAGETNDARIEDLIWGLMLLRGDSSLPIEHHGARGDAIPNAYAVLKLLFLPRPLVIERGRDGLPFARLARANESGIAIYAEPSIPALLRAGRLGEACIVAMRRLRASGLDPLPGPLRGRGVREGEWGELDRMGSAGLDPQRLAAALLIPISDGAVNNLVRLVIRTDDLVDE